MAMLLGEYTPTASEVRARIVSPSPALTDQFIEAKIEDAVDELAVQLPRLAEWVTDDAVRERAGKIVRAAVVRVAKNPQAFRQLSIDDFQGTLDRSISSGELYFTDEELASLRPALPALGGIYSLPMGVPYWGRP